MMNGILKTEYKIFRLTNEGYLKDINFKSYNNYLKAENVIRELKKLHKKRKFTIITIYK